MLLYPIGSLSLVSGLLNNLSLKMGEIFPDFIKQRALPYNNVKKCRTQKWQFSQIIELSIQSPVEFEIPAPHPLPATERGVKWGVESNGGGEVWNFGGREGGGGGVKVRDWTG